jgi:glycosyltransferase involved in cell wall biosynthesis
LTKPRNGAELRSEMYAPKAIQFPVHNADYPRNRRIRHYLAAQGWDCIPIARGRRGGATLKEKVAALLKLLTNAPGKDVIILSEMSLKYAPLTWAIAKITGALHVVDGFIGLYETDVEDKGIFAEGSLRARILRFQDDLALHLADVYLVDTEVRAELIRAKSNGKVIVHSLPVGAPAWARTTDHMPTPSSPSEVLYYGNYIPLHGLEDYVLAIASIPAAARPTTRMIGYGDCYDSVRKLVSEQKMSDFFTFQQPVPETDLFAAIAGSKVVLGIFGTSTKASTVIANKVWQGLACGRPVVTRQSSALEEVSAIAGDLLIQVPSNDSEKLAEALLHALERQIAGPDSDVTYRLEAYVTEQYDKFLETLTRAIPSSFSYAPRRGVETP